MATRGRNFRVTGIEEASRNLTRALQGINGHTREGMQEAAKIVKDASKDLTSIDTGELIGSAFFRTGFDEKGNVIAIVGYGIHDANYAAAVHEMPNDTNWQRPGAENKFLEKGVMRNITRILNALIRSTRKNPL